MSPALSAAKLVLLAVHLASHADINGLSSLVAQHDSILRKDLVLRILLTYLPETISPEIYIDFVRGLALEELPKATNGHIDTSPVDALPDEQASKKLRKLHLLGLPSDDHTDLLTSFLFHRGYRMDEEAGMLPQLPRLLSPFLEHSPAIQTWLVSTVLPLLRRNHDYYPEQTPRYSLQAFQNLPDRIAIEYLLSHTGSHEDGLALVGRDFRGLVGPWLYSDSRWKEIDTETQPGGPHIWTCPGWEHVMEWLLSQASKSWKVALHVIEQWDGPEDVDLGDQVNMWLNDAQQRYLEQSYAKAALGSVYTIPEASLDALEGAYHILYKIRSLMDQETEASLHSATTLLPTIPSLDLNFTPNSKMAAHMRNDILTNSNPLTTPNATSTDLLLALVVSATVLTQAGIPCTVRRAGDLAFIQDIQEQKSEVARFIRSLSSRAPKNDDEYWIRIRKEMLWLRDWGTPRGTEPCTTFQGVFGTVPSEYIETEFLKALLSNTRYALARKLYEEDPAKPLSAAIIQNTVQSSALSAFDNASNPNRTRGGLKKCDDIIHAFPEIMNKSLPATQKLEALLKATHSLSDYRLVLKQGEPFSPVVLRVHSDPISIIEKVLEQNSGAYTRLQEFLEMGVNIVKAGLSIQTGSNKVQSSLLSGQDAEMLVIEKRIVAMCIEAALREDDFETAYSYVVSRLGSPSMAQRSTAGVHDLEDEWSWNAALRAGQYVRTERSKKPTHLGTASGNLEIRHLEQRIECLATALRIAPSCQLQEILKPFRRCEEQLESAVKEEAAREDAWDAAADFRDVPGSFNTPDPDRAYPSRNLTASAAARQAEEAPMSLFDLSRATARVAQRNFTALSDLQGVARGMTSSMVSSQSSDMHDDQQRVRKRDQLREAATGTLVSGVGWLIGANMNRGGAEEAH